MPATHSPPWRSRQWWWTPGFWGWVSPWDGSEKSRILHGTAPTPCPLSPLRQVQHSPGCNVGTSYVLTSRGPFIPRSHTRRGSTCRQDNGGSPLSLCPFLTLPSYGVAPRAEPHTGRSSQPLLPAQVFSPGASLTEDQGEPRVQLLKTGSSAPPPLLIGCGNFATHFSQAIRRFPKERAGGLGCKRLSSLRLPARARLHGPRTVPTRLGPLQPHGDRG